ncbi:MAG: hypothetical protein KDA52_17890 [Planctomycetaceae bacterium]|nr:hypothetical protein [Planctomycetaceae bacterium]
MAMGDESRASVSEWLRQLEEDDSQAAQKLWDRYYSRLVALADPRSRDLAKGGADPEDVAVSVMESLWRGARAGRLQDVKTRDELWWLLLALTKRKIIDHHRNYTAQKRGGHVVISSLGDGNSRCYQFEEIVSVELSPSYLAALEEEFSRLLALLRDDQLRQIAVHRVEGYTNDEICELLSVSASTITRKLRLIRSTWAREIEA